MRPANVKEFKASYKRYRTRIAEIAKLKATTEAARELWCQAHEAHVKATGADFEQYDSGRELTNFGNERCEVAAIEKFAGLLGLAPPKPVPNERQGMCRYIVERDEWVPVK